METLKIDGSICHGGGQILRSALALSAILGKPFEMHSIRKIAPSQVFEDSIFAEF